ncbi:serine/threonine-protein kinase [Caenimonas soli]|uniref:serine/threonine-protein kinase n=1 Tax=Caenimonas soli TaxID=2735555 RepID=UPI001553B83E|nr:protein kinase [Caenimonas soli]NPC56532.1 protein kinase [Caenimonas soli]
MSLKKLGRYDLVRVLGKGAMGIVYEGRDPNLERRVAIKTVKVENLSEEAAAEYESRFRTEARSAARLQHPNIVSVYDSDRDGDMAYLVMEYIQGDDLKHHLDKGHRYSLEQSLKMIRDLLSALDYAHKQGVVHRDIKPANLLIEPGGRVKLTDFGVARMQDSGEATRTQGSMVGTLKYMSPEQVQGQKIDSRADLFSVGVVLYQLLTDKRPFDGDNDFSIIHQIIGHTPPPPSSFNTRLPSAIDAVVARALAKDREQRFATARDFASALQSAIRRAEDATIVPPANPSRKPDSPAAGENSMTGGSTVTQELELVYWKDIKDSTDPEELLGFLDKFPAGIYADLARRRIRKLAGAGSSPDQTVLSGRSIPAVPGGQDLETTRAYTATTPLVAAQPAQSGEDSAPTVTEPTGTPTPPENSVASAAPTEPPPSPPSVEPAAPTRRKTSPAVFAALGAVALGGIAALFLMGKPGPGQTAAGPASSASSPRNAAVVAPVVVAAAPGVMDAAQTPTAIPAPAGAARRPASAAKAKGVASAPAPETSRPVVLSEPAPQRNEPRPVSTHLAAAAHSAVEACKDKLFLSKEFCLSEQCEKAGTRNHPLCAKRREEARLREDSRLRN